MNKRKNLIISILGIIVLAIPFLVSADYFKPATLFKNDSRIAVYSKPEADKLFSLGYQLETQAPGMLGISIPEIVANFETSLALPITATATSSMTLVSGTTDDGTTLNGMYGFVIDSGSANQEYVLATCVNTACSALTRGVSTVTGNTSITALQFSHRRGATVKITDHPILVTLSRILQGLESTPGGLTFGTSTITGITSLSGFTTPSSVSTSSVANVDYVNNITVSGAPNAAEGVKGIVDLATQSQMASGESSGVSSSNLVLQSKYASSTSSATTTIPITKTDGKLDSSFIDQSANYTFSGINSLATTTVSRLDVIGTSTFSVSPIVISQGSYTFVGNHVGTSSDTITHNLGVIPYYITFDYFGGGSTATVLGSGKYTIASSSIVGARTKSGGTSFFGNSTNIIYFSDDNVTCTGTLISSNISTSTAIINNSGCNQYDVSINVTWTAWGIRQ